MVTDGGALAVSMMEAAVRAAVAAGAPRRTVAATAAAVASAMAARQNGDGEGGIATEPSAVSQRRKKKYAKKKERRKAAKEHAMHNAQADGLDLWTAGQHGDHSQVPCAESVESTTLAEAAASLTDVMSLIPSSGVNSPTQPDSAPTCVYRTKFESLPNAKAKRDFIRAMKEATRLGQEKSFLDSIDGWRP